MTFLLLSQAWCFKCFILFCCSIIGIFLFYFVLKGREYRASFTVDIEQMALRRLLGKNGTPNQPVFDGNLLNWITSLA